MSDQEYTTLRGQLLQQARNFCEEEDISLAKLGRIVLNDTGFFARVEKGGGFTVRTYDAFQKFFNETRHARKSAA